MAVVERATFLVETMIGLVSMTVSDSDHVSFDTRVVSPQQDNIYMIGGVMYVADISPDIITADVSKRLFVTGLSNKYKLSHAVTKKQIDQQEYYIAMNDTYALSNRLNVWDVKSRVCRPCKWSSYPKYIHDAALAHFKAANGDKFSSICQTIEHALGTYFNETNTFKKVISTQDEQLDYLHGELLKLDEQIKRYQDACQGPMHITPAIRRSVWRNSFKNNSKGTCACCDTPIHVTRFECAHVVARCLGGAATLKNLVPCCHACNRDMGVMDLDVYRERLLGKLPRRGIKT